MGMMAGNQPLLWQPHKLLEGTEVHQCVTCLRRWAKRPDMTKNDCPGLPVYQWGEVPEGLFTSRQLGEKRLIPAEPRGLLYWSKAPDNYLRLYLESEATPKKPLTEKQIAAVERMREANSPEGRERRRRAEVAKVALQWLHDLPFVVIDTETCSLDPSSGIIEIAVIDHTGAVLIDTRLNPHRPISSGAQAVHGISDADVQDAPTFHDIYPALAEAINGKVWVGYSVDFDTDFIRAECRHWVLPKLSPADRFVIDGVRYGNFHDVKDLYATWWGDWHSYFKDYRWQPLDAARQRHNLYCGDMASHSALGDVLATLSLLRFMAAEKTHATGDHYTFSESSTNYTDAEVG